MAVHVHRRILSCKILLDSIIFELVVEVLINFIAEVVIVKFKFFNLVVWVIYFIAKLFVKAVNIILISYQVPVLFHIA